MKIPPHGFLLAASCLFMALATFAPETRSWLAAAPTTRQASGPQTIGPDRYLGSFRVPEDDGSNRSAKKPKYSYSYGGRLVAADGERLWLATHARHRLVGQISIPAPVQPTSSTAFGELPVANNLKPAVDITGGLRAKSVQGTKRPMVLGDAVSYKNRLYWVFHDYYNVSQTKYRVLGAFDPQTGVVDGPFGLIDAARQPIRDQLSGRYLATVPAKWSAQVQGALVCGGGGLPGQAEIGAGPSLYSFNPPAAGADPYQTYATTHPLLLYPFDDDKPKPSRRALAGWNRASRPFDVVWIKDSVVFAVRFGRGKIWYGAHDQGPGGATDWFITDKSYHAQWYELQFLFYDANDIAAVARGKLQPHQPQPYARIPIPHLMGDDPGRAQVSPVSLSWDAQTERLYLVQGLADHSRGKFARHPVVHVYDLQDIKSIRAWAEQLANP